MGRQAGRQRRRLSHIRKKNLPQNRHQNARKKPRTCAGSVCRGRAKGIDEREGTKERGTAKGNAKRKKKKGKAWGRGEICFRNHHADTQIELWRGIEMLLVSRRQFPLPTLNQSSLLPPPQPPQPQLPLLLLPLLEPPPRNNNIDFGFELLSTLRRLAFRRINEETSPQ